MFSAERRIPYREQQLRDLSDTSREDLHALVEYIVGINPALALKINAQLNQMRGTTGQRLIAASEKDLSDTSREDLHALVEHIVGIYPALALEINAQLNQMRETTGQRLIAALEIELSDEHAEFLEKLEAQYPTMRATLERYEISTEGIPTWEQVKKCLTPEILDKALKLAEPALLLVSPVTRQSKVNAINKHPSKDQKYDTFIYDRGNAFLWNGGEYMVEHNWRAYIVEGVQDVQQDEEIYDGKRNNDEMIKLWIKKYKDQGLDVINDADAYLTLVMKGLAEDKPIDQNSVSVLNGKNMKKHHYSPRVATGYWGNNCVSLFCSYLDFTDKKIRLRGSVEVPVFGKDC